MCFGGGGRGKQRGGGQEGMGRRGGELGIEMTIIPINTIQHGKLTSQSKVVLYSR